MPANSLRVVNATLCTMQVGPDPAGRLPDGAVVCRGREIVWVGPQEVAPEADRTIDAGGRVVTPGLIDCHTHLVFAGDRALDYRRRTEGISYQEIAKAGGGILSTVRATRAASEEELAALARARLDRFLARGVTTVEAKSGYGLTLAEERKILRATRAAAAGHAVEVEPTFLGAHAVAPEHAGDVDRYAKLVAEEMVPAIAEEKLARFCDVFLERGFFGEAHARAILGAAAARGMKPKLHADQLSAGRGAELAAELGAVSADHLEHASDAGLAALANAGTVAVLLPTAALFLGQEPTRVERFRMAGVRTALATDLNPGTSPTDDLLLACTLGASTMGMSLFETLQAVTVNAAAAVDRPDLGTLAPGKQADLVIWDAPGWEHLAWHFGATHAAIVVKAGRVVRVQEAAPECRPSKSD